MLQVIPVIDLKQNQVVHAKQGQRAHYQPLKSLLCDTSHIFSVVEGLLKLYPFRIIYIADIDAITNTGSHFEQIELLSGMFPQVVWWVDIGVRNVNARLLYAPQVNIRAVFGSEQIHTLQNYRAMSYAYESRHILSLDQFNHVELGAKALFETGLYWPDDVLCMTLDNVGSNTGPDIARLQTLQSLNHMRKKPANIFAAGGVRNCADLNALKQLGLTGALVASALHNGAITSQHLTDICNHDVA